MGEKTTLLVLKELPWVATLLGLGLLVKSTLVVAFLPLQPIRRRRSQLLDSCRAVDFSLSSEARGRISTRTMSFHDEPHQSETIIIVIIICANDLPHWYLRLVLHHLRHLHLHLHQRSHQWLEADRVVCFEQCAFLGSCPQHSFASSYGNSWRY